MKLQLTERGLVAIVTLVCCTTLIVCGKDTVVGYTMLSVVVGYFGLTVALPHITSRKGD